MRFPIVLTGVLLAVVAIAPAFGQALAEGAMVHANAAAATAKAGTSMGNSLNKAMSNNGDRLHSATSAATRPSNAGQVQTVPHAATTAHATPATGASASGGLQITSIRGGNTAAKTACPAAVSTSGTTPANTNAAPQPCNTPAPPQPAKSVVHVNFP